MLVTWERNYLFFLIFWYLEQEDNGWFILSQTSNTMDGTVHSCRNHAGMHDVYLDVFGNGKENGYGQPAVTHRIRAFPCHEPESHESFCQYDGSGERKSDCQKQGCKVQKGNGPYRGFPGGGLWYRKRSLRDGFGYWVVGASRGFFPYSLIWNHIDHCVNLHFAVIVPEENSVEKEESDKNEPKAVENGSAVKSADEHGKVGK